MRTLAAVEATAQLGSAPDRLAEFNATAVYALAAMSAEQRITQLRSMASGISNAAAIGLFLMTRDTPAVVDLLRENPRGFESVLRDLAGAAEDARRLLEIIDVAESRIVAGLAAIAKPTKPHAIARALT